MEDNIIKLKDELDQFLADLDFQQKLAELGHLNAEIKKDDFWSNSQRAGEISQKQARLEKFLNPLIKLENQLADLQEILSLGDASLAGESDKELENISFKFSEIKKRLPLHGSA